MSTPSKDKQSNGEKKHGECWLQKRGILVFLNCCESIFGSPQTDFNSAQFIWVFDLGKRVEWTNEVTWLPWKKTKKPLPISKSLQNTFFAKFVSIQQLNVFRRRGGCGEASNEHIKILAKSNSPANFTWPANISRYSVRTVPLSPNESNSTNTFNSKWLTPPKKAWICPTALAEFQAWILTEAGEKNRKEQLNLQKEWPLLQTAPISTSIEPASRKCRTILDS